MSQGNHFPNGSSHTQLSPQSLEMITAATIAALNQHLASIGFLPRVAATPSDKSTTNTASLPPAARDASPIPPRTLTPPPAPHTDRTAATQLLVQSMRDSLSGIYDVADPSGSVTMRSPSWVSGWHAPLLKLTKASIVPNRNNTHTLHRLVDDLFDQQQERLASGVDGPGASKTLLTDVADHFDCAPRSAALASLQKFGVLSGTLFSSYLHFFRVMLAGTVDKGGPLAPSPDMAMELIRIRTAQQYATLMPTLFPDKLATQEKSYDSLAALWVAFAYLKHNTSPAIDGDAFSSANQGLSSLIYYVAASSISPVTSPPRNMRRFGRQDAAQGVLNVSPTHSRRDPFAAGYGLWPFDD